ncbi:deoxynucleoside kinase [Gemmatimonadota bacterium]
MTLRQPIRSEVARRPETRALTYIAVEGAPGSGKTALAGSLARELEGQLVLDRASENPFLDDFRRDPGRYAFKTQLFFTLSRWMQQETIAQRDLFHPLVISDYLFVKDRIHASLTLDDRELALYEKLVGLMVEGISRPDLVIYLQCSATTLGERLKGRGGGRDRRLSDEYLVAVVEAYNYYFLHFEESPLLILQGHDIDAILDARFVEELLDLLAEPHSGIRFWNPMVRSGENG